MRIVIEEGCSSEQHDPHDCWHTKRTVLNDRSEALRVLFPDGPDYRAATIEWIGDKPPEAYPDDWEQMITSVIEQTVKPIVDAAFGLAGQDE